MRIILIILIFCSCTATQPTSSFTATKPAVEGYSAIWTTGSEAVVKQYEIQQSIDTTNWTTLGTVTPGAHSYTYSLGTQTGSTYFRIYARGDTDFATAPILVLVASNFVNISNAVATSTSLLWTVSGAVNVSSFLVEKTADGKNYSKTTQKEFLGSGKYSYRISKTKTKYSYRLTVIFKNKKTQVINFK